MRILPADPLAPEPRALLEASHALFNELFPPEDCYALQPEALKGPDMRFYIAEDGCCVLGTGALALKDGYGEIKSMFTAPFARGRGVADAMLKHIEKEAHELGLPELRLETAKTLKAAVRLYKRHGFTERGIYGDYQPNSISVYMSKML